MKKIAILQSNYLPWKGVFDMINQVDTFVFLEDVQYTRQDWRNRNKIKTKDGDKWIILPVKNTDRSKQLVCEAEIDNNSNWRSKHYNSFQMNYGKAKYFKQYSWILDEIFKGNSWMNLSELNIYITKLIAKELGIKTEFTISTTLDVGGKKDDRLIEICKKLNATHYLSGPAAKNYIVPEKFENAGIELQYMQYEYPRYKQLHEPFNHYVTILDLIFNEGPDAAYYIWGWRKDKGVIQHDTL